MDGITSNIDDTVPEDAKAAASKYVANMLQRPDQLEKVGQYKKRVSRQKALIDAQLKTAVQSQLDGVRTGLSQLQSALGEIQEIKSNLQEVEVLYQQVKPLDEKLHTVREENTKHCQYAAAVENLKHIFNVPESVERTQVLISQDKFLQSHKCLTDLENSRDDLLFELHKLPKQSSADTNLLTQYFSSVEKLSDSLAKKMFLVLSRTLLTARKEPAQLVSVLRIIEREEKRDEFFASKERQTGFLPPGRPKSWKDKALESLQLAAETRIEGNQIESREEHKLWLVRHLEITRQIILEDLRIVKQLCVSCFPPHYDIMNKYINMYHTALSQHLQELVNNNLEGNEIVSLLTWINDYHGPDMMGHEDLQVKTSSLDNLLDKEVKASLMESYLSTIHSNIQAWIPKTIQTENKDWQSDQMPECDADGYYHTHVPVILFQMVEQNIQVAAQINSELTLRVVTTCVDEMLTFSQKYKVALQDYRQKHAEDRNQPKYFYLYVIAIVNNCLALSDFLTQLKARYVNTEKEPGLGEKFTALLNGFSAIAHDGCKVLLDEVFLDLQQFVAELITKKWLTGSTRAMDIICGTLDDYSNDFRHLKLRYFDQLILEAQLRLLAEYIKAMMQKKLTFNSHSQRMEAAELIQKDSQQLQTLFNRLAPGSHKKWGNTWEVLPALAEMLKTSDPSMLAFEVAGLVKKYPDVKAEHLIAVTMLRGDVSRSDMKQLVIDTIDDIQRQDQTIEDQRPGIFSRVPVI